MVDADGRRLGVASHEMKKLAKNQAKQIRALKRMKDEDIDFSDISKKTDWSGAVVGKFSRPDQEVAHDSD